MTRRALALLLAWLLLLSQQLGVQHQAAHGLGRVDGAATSQAAGPVASGHLASADEPAPANGGPADPACPVCLLLAGLALALLPAALRWRGTAGRPPAPPAGPPARQAAPAGCAYLARAPPALPA